MLWAIPLIAGLGSSTRVAFGAESPIAAATDGNHYLNLRNTLGENILFMNTRDSMGRAGTWTRVPPGQTVSFEVRTGNYLFVMRERDFNSRLRVQTPTTRTVYPYHPQYQWWWRVEPGSSGSLRVVGDFERVPPRYRRLR